MRYSLWMFVWAVVGVWVCAAGPVVGGGFAVGRRQEGEERGDVSERPEPTRVRKEEEEPTESVKETSKPTETTKKEDEDKPKQTSTNPGKPEPTEEPEEKVEASSLGKEKDPSALPLQPKITPAMGLAGGLLMLLGLPYAFIGVKRRKVQIFLSTMFMGILGVTVLIIYVMNPLVSNGLQAGYLVIALVTGCILAGIAIVFSDLVEGLGCALGGFCLSMWFLTLKEDGLTTSQAGRTIIISVFSVLGFTLSFHELTRPYALIGSTAFAGSTAVALGVDCFARAGLKEFWLYLWNINDNIFPFNTTTYPHTRGLRVEIALIVILTFFAILSQIRLWKIIRERRSIKEQAREQKLQDADARDVEVGREIVERTAEERRAWETKFAPKESTEEVDEKERGSEDSGFGNIPGKGAVKDQRRESVMGIEMMAVKSPRVEERPVLDPFDTRHNSYQSSHPNRTSADATSSRSIINKHHSRNPSTPSHSRHTSAGTINPLSIPLPSSPTPPKIIPVPPTYVPDFSDTESYRSRSPSIKEGYVGNNSPGVIFRRESYGYEKSRSQRDPPSSAMVYDDDRASSLDAHWDGRDDLTDDGEPLGIDGPEDDERRFSNTSSFNNKSPRFSTQSSHAETSGQRASLLLVDIPKANFDETLSESPVEESEKTSTTEATSLSSRAVSPKLPQAAFLSTLDLPRSTRSRPATILSTAESSSGSLSQLQDHGARMPKSYRTDEWAKQAAEADAPEVDPITVSAPEEETEAPRPVDVVELLKTSAVAVPPIAKRASRMEADKSSKRISTDSFRRGPVRVSTVPVVASMGFSPAERSPINRNFSASPMPPQIPRTGAATPVPSFGPNTLLAKRETLLRNKASYITPSPTPDPHHSGTSTPAPLSRAPSSQLLSRAPSAQLLNQPLINRVSSTPVPASLLPRAGKDEDDIPLSQRRSALLQNRHSRSPSTTAPSDSEELTPLEKQERQMRAWRESVRAEQDTLRTRQMATPMNRGEVERGLRERVEREQRELMEREERERLERMRAERMRMPDMVERHRVAMERLQGSVRTESYY